MTWRTLHARPYCVAWIAYSILIEDYFLFFSNGPGLMVESSHCVLKTHPYTSTLAST